MKNKTLNPTSPGRLLLGCCAVLFCVASVHAQDKGERTGSGVTADGIHNSNQDSFPDASKKRSLFNVIDAHIGWGAQEAFFAGFQFITLPYIVRADIGSDFFASTRSLNLSFTIGWMPGGKSDSSEISGVFYSLIQTLQVDNSSANSIPQIYTFNIGWIATQPVHLDYSLSAGAGMKIMSSLRKATLFVGINFSIGFRNF